MRRRDFSQVALLSASAWGLSVPVAHAQAKAPVEGKDYIKLSRPAPVDTPAPKVEVLEFFGYWCPHCARFEPAFEAWAKKAPAHMAVRRVPVAFRDNQVPMQRLYFALEAMGKVDELHGKVFTAIHGDKANLSTQDDIANWVAKNGVDKAKFLEQYNSFSVSTKSGKGTQLQNTYKVEGVPALGVAGRFYTDGTLSKTMERGLQIVDYLIAEIRAGR